MTKILQQNKFDFYHYINYALIGYAFFLPFSKAGVNLFETIALLLWIVSADWKNRVELYKQNLFLMVFVAFLAFSIVSILWADDVVFAIKYVLKYRHFLILFVIYSALKEKFIGHIFSAFLLGMFISELVSYGIFFELIHYKNILPTDPSPFMSHTDYSIYLSFASMILLTRILHTEEFKSRLVYITFFLTVTTNLFVNGGRTGQITFIILVFVNFLHFFKNKIKAFFIASSLLIVIFGLAYNFSPNFQQRFIQAEKGISDMIYKDTYTSDGFSQRVAVWILGVDKMKDNLLLGTGIGSDMKNMKYYAQKRGFDADMFNENVFGDHHNVFLTESIQLGLFGLVLMLMIFYSLMKLKFQTYSYKILNMTFVTAFFLWSFGGMTFHTMNPMIFFSLFAGVFNKISNIEMKEQL